MRYFCSAIAVSLVLLSVSRPACAEDAHKAIAICMGLNAVNPSHYAGWPGTLKACEFDAEDMGEIASSNHFDVTKLLTTHATRGAFIGALSDAAGKLKSGDILVVSYSGHGGSVPDQNGDEADNQDETWCLYDGEVLDDELAAQWAKFQPGVRIVLYSDSCHSGTVSRNADYERMLGTVAFDPVEVRSLTQRFEMSKAAAPDKKEKVESPVRAMPDDIARETYRANKKFYDDLGKSLAPENKSNDGIKATVLLISGCQDNQLSLDGTFNGLFTGSLKQAWAGGAFKGNYLEFRNLIVDRMPPYQSPNYYVIGAANPDFEKEKPWTK